MFNDDWRRRRLETTIGDDNSGWTTTLTGSPFFGYGLLSPKPEDDTSFISRDDWGRLRLEIASLRSDICTLRIQHDEELKAIRAELEAVRSSTQNPLPTTQPVIQTAQQPILQPDSQTVQFKTNVETPPKPSTYPDSQPIPQSASQPVSRPASRSATEPAVNSVSKTKKRRKKTCSGRDCLHQQDNDLVTKSLAYASLRLDKDSQNILKVPQLNNLFNRLSPKPTPIVLPIPYRNKFSPGFHPGVIPFMDIISV